MDKKKRLSMYYEKDVRLAHILKPIYFVLFATLLEMVNFMWLKFYVTGNAEVLQVLPKYFFLDFGVYLLVAGAIFLSDKVWLENIFFYLFIGFQVFINMVNATLFKVFGDIFSFDMMRLGREAAAAFQLDFVDLWSIVANVSLLVIIAVLQQKLDKNLKVKFKLKRLNRLALCLVCFLSCWLVGSISYFAQTRNFYDTNTGVRVSESDQYLWDNMQFKLEAYKKFGTYGFYLKSIGNMIYKNDNFDQNTRDNLLAEIEDGKVEENTSATLYGHNLIVLMLESFEWFAVDPIYTPTLWKLKTEQATVMNNFYSKNKTNMSEDISILGNMPKDNAMYDLAKSGALNNEYTLPNLFKERGYAANYFHGYLTEFYDRDVINKGMGFENVYGLEHAEIENKSTKWHDWSLDSDIMTSMLDKFIPTDRPFFSYYTTIATHGPYSVYNERIDEAGYYDYYDQHLEEYKTWLAESSPFVYPESEKTQKSLREYKCAAMDTDKMVKIILDDLEAKGLLATTDIVMFGDHYCYYENLCFEVKDTEKSDYYDIYNYNVLFMIYSQTLGHQNIDTFCSPYDIYPTICDLFGLPYNSYLTQGYSIFSPKIKDTVFVSYLSGIFDYNFYTLNIVDMHYRDGATQKQLVRFKRNACRFYEKQYNLELIYKYNLLYGQKIKD